MFFDNIIMETKKGLEIDLLPVERGDHSGDCIALRYGDLYAGGINQTVVVIDGGYASSKDKLKSHLKQYYNCEIDGKLTINIVFLSHPDQDHVEGLVKLLEDDDVQIVNLVAMIPWKVMTLKWFEDGRITEKSLEKRLEDSFKLLASMIELAKSKGVTVIMPTELQNPCEFHEATFLTLGPELGFYKTCIANCEKTPDKASHVQSVGESVSFSANDKEEPYVRGQIKWNYSEGTSPINESSHIMLFEYDGHKILFCGDAGMEALEKAINYAAANNISLNNINIIKMPHHGSRKNVTPELMDTFKNKDCRCYISCIKGDEGHHPSKRLVNMLLEKGFRVLTTSGSTLHRGWNEPDRGWKSVSSMTPYPKMEKV